MSLLSFRVLALFLSPLLSVFFSALSYSMLHTYHNFRNMKGGEIIEFGCGEDRKNGVGVMNMKSEVLVYSHSGGELWGLALHPTISDLYVTVGDDCTLRVWSLNLNKMIHSVNLGSAARSVCFHPSGGVIAIGFMEKKKNLENKNKDKVKDKEKMKKESQIKYENLEGAVHLYSFTLDSSSSISTSISSNSNVSNYASISVLKLAQGCNTVSWVNEVNFSPTGGILAVGSHDKKLYFYDVPGIPQGGSAFGDVWGQCLRNTKFVFDKHSSAVLHSDFSNDGKYLQTDSQVIRTCVCMCVCVCHSIRAYQDAKTKHKKFDLYE